jgi:CRP-like cAMP-binding protein
MKRVPLSSHSNRLLAGLTPAAQRRFVAACDTVEFNFAEVLSEPGDRIRHVYFPTGGFVSMSKRLPENHNLEVAMVGSEGMLGTSLLLGVSRSPLHVIVQGAGQTLRMKAESFQSELTRSTALQRRLRRYLYVTVAELAQTAACTHYHLIEARLARWLLMTQDRAHSPDFFVTQLFLAYMLGVRRVGITKAAGDLHSRGLIQYRRGNMTILNRRGLEAASCRCYRADRASYDRIMGTSGQ